MPLLSRVSNFLLLSLALNSHTSHPNTLKLLTLGRLHVKTSVFVMLRYVRVPITILNPVTAIIASIQRQFSRPDCIKDLPTDYIRALSSLLVTLFCWGVQGGRWVFPLYTMLLQLLLKGLIFLSLSERSNLIFQLNICSNFVWTTRNDSNTSDLLAITQASP